MLHYYSILHGVVNKIAQNLFYYTEVFEPNNNNIGIL